MSCREQEDAPLATKSDHKKRRGLTPATFSFFHGLFGRLLLGPLLQGQTSGRRVLQVEEAQVEEDV